MHHTPRVETYEIASLEGHFGGDAALAHNFVEIMKGSAASISPLEDGLISTLMCLKEGESAKSGTFQSITWE